MSGQRTPRPMGRDPAADAGISITDGTPVVGLDERMPDDVEELSNTPKITKVTRDWTDPPTPRVTFDPVVSGKNLKEVLADLERRAEWGTGGGNLNGTGVGEEIQLETKDGKNYSVALKGDFFMSLPKWEQYERATAEQKKAWDTMIANLRKHEEEHVAIAYRGAQRLMQTLQGLPVTLAAERMAQNSAKTQENQDAFDTKTEHGHKESAGFNKVELDTSADPPDKKP